MAKVPPSDTYLFTRTQVPPVTTPTRDPCNFPETYKPRHEAVNLWASLQTKGECKADRDPALGHSMVHVSVCSEQLSGVRAGMQSKLCD